ncbi:MAG: hypothetical protein GXX84_09300 [Acidobacteria bacterium]|nr:hypothetical protein [Acidobacteriota bacterium]
MRKIIELKVDDLTPTRMEVLEAQGMANRQTLPPAIEGLLEKALDLFRKLAEPKGLLQDVTLPDFESIYEGNGNCEAPVPMIVPKADTLALFAATLGSPLIEESSNLFTKGGASLGFMLDAVNTSAAERMGRLMCRNFFGLLPEQKRNGNTRVQYYCPGHCGWEIAGQTKLFATLKPEEIGVTLNSRQVMQPIKSLSGVLIAGNLEIHRFQPAFSFCPQCRERKCVSRLRLLENENLITDAPWKTF